MRGNNSCTNKTKRLSPMTLLERFREAVFRLIMLSAVSSNKATSSAGRSSTDVQRYYCPHDDPHNSEAVADCIEFIKKTASPEDDIRGSSASSTSSSSIDTMADRDVVIPVLVM